jgi:hypothetical protein
MDLTWDEVLDVLPPPSGDVGEKLKKVDLGAELRKACEALGFSDFRMVADSELPLLDRKKRYITSRQQMDLVILVEKYTPRSLIAAMAHDLAVEMAGELPAGATITEPILWASREAFMLTWFMYTEATG